MMNIPKNAGLINHGQSSLAIAGAREAKGLFPNTNVRQSKVYATPLGEKGRDLYVRAVFGITKPITAVGEAVVHYHQDAANTTPKLMGVSSKTYREALSPKEAHKAALAALGSPGLAGRPATPDAVAVLSDALMVIYGKKPATPKKKASKNKKSS